MYGPEKLRENLASDSLISMIKRCDFVIEDIHAETIRELETLISDSSISSSIFGLNTKRRTANACLNLLTERFGGKLLCADRML